MTQSVDDFLASNPAVSSFLATIEPVADKDHVRVTPWVNGDCACDASLVIPKSAIASLTRTNDTHSCCGKRLSVAEVIFAEGSKVFTTIFDQLLARRAADLGAFPLSESRGAEERRPKQSCVDDCWSEFRWCKNNCGYGFPCYTCKPFLSSCLQNCGR